MRTLQFKIPPLSPPQTPLHVGWSAGSNNRANNLTRLCFCPFSLATCLDHQTTEHIQISRARRILPPAATVPQPHHALTAHPTTDPFF